MPRAEDASRRAAASIHVRQDGVRDEATHPGGYRADESGGWVWHASTALETALSAEVSGTWEGRRVLELGAGTGWLSLRIATQGALVTATDRDGAVPRMLRNVLRNQARAPPPRRARCPARAARRCHPAAMMSKHKNGTESAHVPAMATKMRLVD